MKEGMLETDDMSLEQIRQAADKEVAAKPAAADTPDAKSQENAEPGDGEIYRATIDLGDGSGVQIFEADSPEALTEKLIEAQTNATKKIREQAARLKELEGRVAEKPKAEEITADQEYIWAQEIVKNPAKVVREIIRKVSGRDIEELKTWGEQSDAQRAYRSQSDAIAAFIVSHPDYEDANLAENPSKERIAAGNRNAEAIKLAMQGKEWTSENLHRAYLDLKRSGLLVLKGEEAHADRQPDAEATERIAQPRTEVVQTRTRRSSGISSHSRSAMPVAVTEPTEDEAYDMPMDKLKTLANKALRQAR